MTKKEMELTIKMLELKVKVLEMEKEMIALKDNRNHIYPNPFTQPICTYPLVSYDGTFSTLTGINATVTN